MKPQTAKTLHRIWVILWISIAVALCLYAFSSCAPKEYWYYKQIDKQNKISKNEQKRRALVRDIHDVYY